jgi:hypothetical protein
MNHSFYSADRSTHLKIIVAALAGIAVSGLALSSRTNPDQGSQHTAGVIKAGKPVTITSSGTSVIR